MEVATKTFTFRSRVSWAGENKGTAAAAGKQNVDVGSPPEFRGHPNVWSPEELLLASVNTCHMLTFRALASKYNIEIASYDSDAEGVLERKDGAFQMTRITIRAVITVDKDLDQARQTAEEVTKNCYMANSVKAQVLFEPTLKLAGE